MCLGATASQTGGSITRPASYCGVAGCKPTYGRVSCHGVVPLAHSMDHPGAIARCVRDLAILLETITGCDHGHYPFGQTVLSWYETVRAGGLSPPRIGRLRGLFDEQAAPAMLRLMDEVVDTLRERGATVVEFALPAGFSEVIVRHRIVMAVEAAQFHGERLRKHPQDYGPNITKLLEEGLACPAPEYARTKEHQMQLRDEMSSRCVGFDALICPATRGPAPDATTTGDPAFNSPWSYTGLPTVSFSVGLSEDGLPLAIQLVGNDTAEEKLFQAAAWCEDVLPGRMPEPPL
jgi:aspartyl-tRNA(Asn)/glutamyl-tRNA(Gln) amidotransferase subunit A